MAIEGRYARHHLIAGWDQQRISRARVMVVGAGAIGNEVVKLLALVGVGHIIIVDFDKVEISNLSRCMLFRESDIGKPKSEVAANRAKDLNPHIVTHAICGDIEFDVGLGVIRSMDLVIGCLDSLNARLAVNRACMRTGVPWINGGISATVAEISIFHSSADACFECGMSDAMWKRRAERFSCGGLKRLETEAPAPTTAVGASLCAAYQVQEALHLLHADAVEDDTPDASRPHTIDLMVSPEPEVKRGLRFGQKITHNLYPYETSVFTLTRNPDCLAHERIFEVVVRPERPPSVSARDLLTWANCQEGVIEFGFDLLVEMNCAQCGEAESRSMPVGRCTDSMLRCAGCSANSRAPVTINWLDAGHPLFDVPLAKLCIPDFQMLSVNCAGERHWFQLGVYEDTRTSK